METSPNTVAHKDRTPSRRDIMLRSPEVIGLIGFLASVYPFLKPMRTPVLEPFDMKVDEIDPGQQVTVTDKGLPILFRRLTPEELSAARETPLDALPDADARNANRPDTSATLTNRLVRPDSDLIVLVGFCTYLGCIPLVGEGKYGGWYCPCHGSQYDTAGRIRSGPAPQNMEIPALSFLDENTIRLG